MLKRITKSPRDSGKEPLEKEGKGASGKGSVLENRGDLSPEDSTKEKAKAIYERETELSFSDLGKWAEGGREEGLDEIQGDFENSGIFEVELDGSPSGRRKV